jgi:pimeloyl-ACP methyl ester carboxylesterase
MMTANTLRLAVGVNPPFTYVRAGGTELAVKRVGAGIPVLCLHATGQGGRDYEDFANRVSSQGFELITLDWPGHGASPLDASGLPASAARYANLLDELVPAVFRDVQPVILGNSIGGAAALQFALRSPQKLRALVLCNPGGLAPLNLLAKTVIAMMVRFFSAGEHGARWFPHAYALYLKLILQQKPAHAQRARIAAAGSEMAPLLKQAWESFRQPEADFRQAVKSLSVPTFFAWAKHDQIVTWHRSKRAVQSLTRARVQMFKGGHAAFLEDPDAFARAFVQFIRTTVPQARDV